jgi:hypothetical protein
MKMIFAMAMFMTGCSIASGLDQLDTVPDTAAKCDEGMSWCRIEPNADEVGLCIDGKMRTTVCDYPMHCVEGMTKNRFTFAYCE